MKPEQIVPRAPLPPGPPAPPTPSASGFAGLVGHVRFGDPDQLHAALARIAEDDPKIAGLAERLAATGNEMAREAVRVAIASIAIQAVKEMFGEAAETPAVPNVAVSPWKPHGANFLTGAWHLGTALSEAGKPAQGWGMLFAHLHAADERLTALSTHRLRRTSDDWQAYWRGLGAMVATGLDDVRAIDDTNSVGEEWKRLALSFVYLAGDHPSPRTVAALAKERRTLDTATLERLLRQRSRTQAALRDGLL